MSTALIVGAGPRLGAAIARRFARDGYDIALVARTQRDVGRLGEVLQGEGITVGWAAVDVADATQLAEAVGRFARHTGGIDVAVHNVSVWREASVLDLTPGQLLADVAAGCASLLTLTQACVPAMPAGGTIIATGSGAADSPSPGAPTVGVQKAALRALVQSLDLQLRPDGIHVATLSIDGVLDSGPQFAPELIADGYARLATETAGPREQWRTVVHYP